ncbi:hypothetical protein F2Q68_00020673 [Brassica cretica]|uniref:Uncharacterized protein n=1 Tax=Brassica cretica TaxID=69181 RepID=A0A8S9FS55_BRACR|nr:hypothetical protein F2Q68_00020673 [Brassica cretica]
MSSRKGSSKRNSYSHSSSGDSSANEVITPKEEFEVEEEANDAYYKALCGSPPPSQDIPIPKRPVRSPNAPLAPSMVSSDYLTTLRDFYQIPNGVVFRIPSGNESVEDPPEGFFTCYEAFLVYSRMLFPIPGTIVRAPCHFGLSISQLSVPALQHWLGMLILSYELGMDLNPGDVEGFWFTRGTGIDGSYRMAPKKGMAIIQGHTSHPKAWFERFFFVRIDGESVEESYLHLFRREWNFTRVREVSFSNSLLTSSLKRRFLQDRSFFSKISLCSKKMSSRKGSSKRNSSSHSSSGDSSANEVIAPKEEFEVEEEAKDAYYKSLCGSPPPSQDISIPKRPVRSPNAPLAPSMVSSDYLTTLKDFYQIPSGVVFRIPSGNKSAKDPPEGFFTCYEAFLHWLGVLILSYELGMDLNPGDFEGFWYTRGTGIDGSYRMAPKKDGESVEESYLHLFCREWNFTRMNRILPPSPAKRDLLRSRPFFWNSFTAERIRSAVELQRSRAVSQPLDVPYGVEPVIDVLPAQRQRIRSRKGKGVASENVLGNLSLPKWNPGFSPGERSGTSEVPLPSDFFADLPPGFSSHKSLDKESRRKVVAEGSSLINEVYPLNFDLNYFFFVFLSDLKFVQGMRVFNAALDGSFWESRISHFKAEEAERELFWFRKEVEEQSRRQAELHSRALVRAERRGKRAIVAEMKRRAALFATEFESFKDAQEFVGDFRECRGSVATLYESASPLWAFDQPAKRSGLAALARRVDLELRARNGS